MVKTDSYVQFEAGKLTYRVVPVTEEIIRMIVSGKRDQRGTGLPDH